MSGPGFLRERVLISDGTRRTFWLEDMSNGPVSVSREAPLLPPDPPHWVLRGRVGRDEPTTIDDPPRELDDYTDAELRQLLERAIGTAPR